MSIHFWIWVLFVIGIVCGFYFWTPADRNYHVARWVGVLLLFAICWAVAGNPVNALIR